MSRSRTALLAFLSALLLLIPAAAAQATPAIAAQKQKAKAKLVAVKAPRATAGAVRVVVRARRDLDRLSVRVNGRRVPVRPLKREGQRTVLTLGATHRVRFGRNLLKVRAAAKDRRQSVKRTVRVRRSSPLVGMRAGRAVQGREIRLDGRATRSARGARLRYRWRVLAGPRRASARLTGSRTARPRLLASHPGRYHVALTVSERRRGGGASAAGGCAVAARPIPARPMQPLVTSDGAIASTPLEQLEAPESALETVAPATRPKPRRLPAVSPGPGRAAPGCTTQALTVDVQPLAEQMGVAFDSMATYVDSAGQTHEGVRVGATFYEVPKGPKAYAIYLDSHTLEHIASAPITTTFPFTVETFATAYGEKIADGRDVTLVLAYPTASLIKAIGETDATAISNEGYQLGDGARPPDAPGRTTGWMQTSLALSGGQPSYRLVLPDRIPIDTQVGAGPRSNTIRVGQSEYPGTLPSGATAGFQVLVLDPALRPQLGTPRVFGTNTTDGGDGAGQAGFASLLREAANLSAATVVVQSIGRPRPTTVESLVASQAIERLGGTEWLFLGLDGTGGYSLVGNPPPLGGASDPTASAEASSQWTGGADGLSGLLERRNDSAFEATLADSADPPDGVGSPDYSFQQVVFQPPTEWPVTVTDATRAAAIYIARNIPTPIPTQGPGLCAPTPEPDLRAAYCDDSLDPDALAGEVADLTYPGGQPFTAEEFAAVQDELRTELLMVANVRATMGTAQKSLLAALATGFGDAEYIATEVIASIPADPGNAVSGDLGLAASALYVAAEVPEVGEAFGFVASVLDLAAELTETDSVPAPDWQIETEAAEAGSQVQDRLLGAFATLNQYGDILVSDYGKLTAAARNAAGPWGVDGQTANAQIGALATGVKGWLYTAIVPSAYDLVRIPGATPANAGDVFCAYSQSSAVWQPWEKAHPSSLFFPLNDWSGTAPKADQMMAMLDGRYDDDGSHAVRKGRGDALMQAMFGDAADGDAGLVAPWFSDRAKWKVQRPQMIPPQPYGQQLRPGQCTL